MRDFQPGEAVLIRKCRKEHYKHEGSVVRKVGRFSYEVEIDGRIGVFNQANLKPCGGKVDLDLNECLDKAYGDAAQREPVSVAPPVVPVPDSVNVPLRRSLRQRRAPSRLAYH